MTFSDVVCECASIPDFVKEFNRLTKSNLGRSLKRKPIEVMIDKATGAPIEDDEDMAKFIAFVLRFVWLTLPESAFEVEEPK